MPPRSYAPFRAPAWPAKSIALIITEIILKPIAIFAALCAALSLSTARAELTCTVLADAGSGKVLKQEGTCDSA